jgi:hypothetical protein
VPESRVTVVDPSTVLMARRKFPGTAALARLATGFRADLMSAG